MKGKKELLILSGLSGAGKSTAIHVMEDAGYFAIDNFPGELFPKLVHLLLHPSKSTHYRRLALVMDARDNNFIRHFEKYLQDLRQQPLTVRIFFFDARDDILIRRFSETRRRHPLAPRGQVIQGINRERALLHPLRAAAHSILDTSNLTIHDLKKKLLSLLPLPKISRRVNVNLLSFGYRFGLPLEADLVFDVRFFPNPHFVPPLRNFSGENSRVRRFVLENTVAKQFLPSLRNILRFLLKHYQKEGKAYVTIALGCTGGRHRSVVVARQMSSDLKRWGYPVSLIHRDISRGG